MWTYEDSTLYTKNNLFARLGLLSLQPKLTENSFYCSHIVNLPVPWGYEVNSGPGFSPTLLSYNPASSPQSRKSNLKRMLQSQKPFSVAPRKDVAVEVDAAAALPHEDLCNSHAYVINLFAALLSGLDLEKKDEICLFDSLIGGEHLNIHFSYPKGEKDGTMMGKLRKKTNFGVKPLWRIEFSPIYSVGGLVQSYREQQHLGVAGLAREEWAMDLQSLESVPRWMLPVNYWGKPAPMTLKRRRLRNKSRGIKDGEENDSEEEDEELDENIYAFEEKITSWAGYLVKTLKEKANTRIRNKRMEIEAITMNVNKLHMGYEDKLASTIRLEEHRNYLLNETRKWKKRNGAWHRRFLNLILRRQVEAILPFNEEESLRELEAAVARMQWLHERLPSQKMPSGWTLCFVRLVGEPLYDLAESRLRYEMRSRAEAQRPRRGGRDRVSCRISLRDRLSGGESLRTETPTLRHRHIRWTRMAGKSYQKRLLARRMNTSLGEMIICGGIRKNVLIARVVVDEALQPEGAIMLEEMELPGCAHREIITQMNSARIGFQDRELCEGNFKSFAVTKTLSGRFLSESSLRVLRTELPGSEIDNTRLRQKILWNIFQESRYNTVGMIRHVIKLQSIFRRKLALSYTRRVKILRDRKSVTLHVKY